ncbi:MAG: CRISPR-associated endonuclease Cas1 [Methanosarcinales archaeon]|jgi:CRISPR-associated protein Cas1|nr:CRISPR-associated endonuclease Cas1 [Methanosarcinales archaeon]
MQLVINSYGAYLKKNNNCFVIKNDDKIFEVSVQKIESILITTSATITTDAIKFAVENNIDIIFLDKHGNPYGRVWHSKLGSTTYIRRRQLEVSTEQMGFKMVKGWIEKKIDNQIVFLKDLKKNRPNQRDYIEGYIVKIERLNKSLINTTGSISSNRERIMGLEGMASKHYFTALSGILTDKWRFNGRSKNPAKDGFNCLLNYGYGVLYSLVEKACIIAGLDPFVGFLHTDNYNKKSLVFDLIEPYRIFVDRVIIGLFSKRKVKDTMFSEIPKGLTLNTEGKAVCIGAINELFDKQIKHKGRLIKIRNIIQYDCHEIANKLIK